MVYLPENCMKIILGYCDDRIEQKQRKAKGKLIEFIYRNHQLSNDISGFIDECWTDKINTPEIIFEEHMDFLFSSTYRNNILFTINNREKDCNKVCKMLNIDKKDKRHYDIIKEAEAILDTTVTAEINYYMILYEIFSDPSNPKIKCKSYI
jgi:hypothetical protein